MRRFLFALLIVSVVVSFGFTGCEQPVTSTYEGDGDGGGGDDGGGDEGGGGDEEPDGAISGILVNGRSVFPADPTSDDYFVDALIRPDESTVTMVIDYYGDIEITVNETEFVTSGDPVFINPSASTVTIEVTRGPAETWRHVLTLHHAPELEFMTFLFSQENHLPLSADHAATEIDTDLDQVTITIPPELEAQKTSLVPTFLVNAPDDTVVWFEGNEIYSDVTPLDFSSPFNLQLVFSPRQSTFTGWVATDLRYIDTYLVYIGSTGPATTDLLSFGFTDADNASLGWGADIDGDLTGTLVSDTDVFVRLPDGSDVTSLIPTFVTGGGSVTVGGVPQTSGTTAQDFTDPVDYTVTDGGSVTYTVIAAAADAGEVSAVIDVLPEAVITYGGSDSASSVTEDMTFPTTLSGGIPATWDASDLSTVSDTGVVTPPAFHQSDESGTIYATVSAGAYSRTLSFPVTVVAQGPNLTVRYGGSIVADGAAASTSIGTDFGTRSEGSSLSRDFTLENTGNQDLTVSAVSLSSTTDYSLSGFTSGTIAAGSTETLTVTFDADASLGTAADTVTITSDDTDITSFDFDVTGRTVPATPGSLTASGETTTTVTLSWTDTSSLNTDYTVRYDDLYFTDYTVGEQVTITLGDGDATGTTITGLTPGKTYEFRVLATGGGESSSYATVTTYTVPTAPSNVTILPLGSEGHQTLVAEYDDVSYADYPDLVYEFFIVADGDGVGQVGTKPGSGDSTSPLLNYDFTGLDEYTEYTIWIDAVTPTGRTTSGPYFGADFEASASDITKTYLAPATTATGDSFTDLATDGFTANWTDVSAANDSYTVIYGSGTSFDTVEEILSRTSGSVVVVDAQAGVVSSGAATGTAESLAVSGLNSGTEYHVWVEASEFGVASIGTRFYLGTVTTN